MLRGEAVLGVAVDAGQLRGKVRPSESGRADYEVRVWTKEDGIAYRCTCPVGEEGRFCKHAVAIALAHLDQVEHEAVGMLDRVAMKLASMPHERVRRATRRARPHRRAPARGARRDRAVAVSNALGGTARSRGGSGSGRRAATRCLRSDRDDERAVVVANELHPATTASISEMSQRSASARLEDRASGPCCTGGSTRRPAGGRRSTR